MLQVDAVGSCPVVSRHTAGHFVGEELQLANGRKRPYLIQTPLPAFEKALEKEWLG